MYKVGISALASSFASCHLEDEDRARSSYMSFSPVGVGHAAKPRKRKTPAKEFRMLKEAYENVPGSQTRVFEWQKVSRGLGRRPGRAPGTTSSVAPPSLVN